MTRVSPQVHAGGGKGLRSAGAAHPRGHRGRDGRGRPAPRPGALAPPRGLRPGEVNTAPSNGSLRAVSVRGLEAAAERHRFGKDLVKSAPRQSKFGNQRLARHNYF